MALQSSATTNFFFPPAGGGLRSATACRAGAVRFFPGKGQRASLRLRCSSGHYDLQERWWTPQMRPEDFVEPTGKGVEEMKAIRDALIRDPLQPVWLAVQEIVATRGNLLRCQGFRVAIVSGPLLLVAGLCKLYTVAPNHVMDIVLGYIFYKMGVLAAHLSRNGKANNLCIRIQQVLIAILLLKCNNPTKDFYYRFMDFLWTINGLVYTSILYYECVGVKYPRQEWEGILIEIMDRFKGMLTIIGDLIKD
ncbi:hypothetical protein EJB05_00848 [Eragrostis curvula]|uniref:Uncharacterized protein n=1 Tax=Eragrostis curvula TaxID=38414 RepID=A0A5J9WNS2_9POAL|nr:hypothetical protein EJB05_00848 [Eragrostis curvula]